MSNKQKLVVILGPTASGKTDLAIKIARRFSGEIISADSRQLYTKMDIGTAKPDGRWVEKKGNRQFLVDGIPHYGVDIIDPGHTFTVAEFQKLAYEFIADIGRRGHVPLLVGGTGLYIWSVVDNLQFPVGEPMKKLRASFEAKALGDLVALLSSVDPDAAAIIDKKISVV